MSEQVELTPAVRDAVRIEWVAMPLRLSPDRADQIRGADDISLCFCHLAAEAVHIALAINAAPLLLTAMETAEAERDAMAVELTELRAQATAMAQALSRQALVVRDNIVIVGYIIDSGPFFAVERINPRALLNNDGEWIAGDYLWKFQWIANNGGRTFSDAYAISMRDDLMYPIEDTP